MPAPPYYAVIFSSLRSESDEAGYSVVAQRMTTLVAQQPGFLGAESSRDAAGFGITVAYFDSEEAIRQWRQQSEHAAARERGRSDWYRHYEVRVAKVERAYGWDRDAAVTDR